MNREIIQVQSKREFSYISHGEHKNFSLIKETQNHIDYAKGTIDMLFIVKRLTDGKFFKGRYTTGSFGQKWMNSFRLTEVFEKQETTTIINITYE